MSDCIYRRGEYCERFTNDKGMSWCVGDDLECKFRATGEAQPDIAAKPYASWLEDVVKTIFDIDPDCISMQMRCNDGKVYTCYWNTSEDDRAIMKDAITNDGILEWMRSNREDILSVLNEEDGDEDGECETDTGPD